VESRSPISPSPLISLELRWFLDGKFPPTLDKWFRESLPGSEISPVDERDDIYLSQSRIDDFGIKLRQGKLEIKWREFARPYKGAHGMAGHVERWLKWGWEDPKGPGPSDISAFAIPRGPWITVAKERRQRKYRWDNFKFVPAPAEDILDFGAAVELTAIELHRRSHSTVLVETFAPDQKMQEKLLDAAVDYLFRDFPKPRPGPARSYGYPHWLGKFGAT